MIYEELLGNEPVPEISDYILNEGIKSNQTRSEMMKEFQILFNEKTEQLVKWLFEVLRPTIRLEATKIEKADRPNKNGDDLLQAFEDPVENERRNTRFDKKTQ